MWWILALILGCGPKQAPPSPPPTRPETLSALEAGDFLTARLGLEHAVATEPLEPDPYLLLTRLHAGSTSPCWALLYGEAFLLLEPYTPRAAEVSALLVAVHRRLSRQVAAETTDPFEAAFHTALGEALNASGGKADLPGIVAWRLALPDALTEPDPIVDWHRALAEAGQLEAYTWWLLRAGDPEAFAAWAVDHEPDIQALRDHLNAEAFQPGRDGLVGRPAHPRPR